MEIARAWEIIERTLRQELPQVAASLRAPASDEDLARLGAAVGKELPPEFVASLRIHDGQDNPTQLLDVFDHVSFLSIDAMIEDLQMRADVLGSDLESSEYEWMTPDRVRTIPNAPGWLRFTDSEGQGWAIDLDPAPDGEAGQVIWLPIDGPTPEPTHTSFGEWMTSLATRLDEGRYAIEDEDCLRLTDHDLYG